MTNNSPHFLLTLLRVRFPASPPINSSTFSQDALYARLQRLRRLLPEADVLKIATSEPQVMTAPAPPPFVHWPGREATWLRGRASLKAAAGLFPIAIFPGPEDGPGAGHLQPGAPHTGGRSTAFPLPASPLNQWLRVWPPRAPGAGLTCALLSPLRQCPAWRWPPSSRRFRGCC